MTSVTGLAASSITSMIPGLCTAGQMKLVGATSFKWQATAVQTVPSIAIPALTGSQIAIVYLELTISSGNSGFPPLGSMTAAGTGLNVGVNLSGYISGGASGGVFKNSAFGTTTTGSQTVTFSAQQDSGAAIPYATAQAAVFIYTPPF